MLGCEQPTEYRKKTSPRARDSSHSDQRYCIQKVRGLCPHRLLGRRRRVEQRGSMRAVAATAPADGEHDQTSSGEHAQRNQANANSEPAVGGC